MAKKSNAASVASGAEVAAPASAFPTDEQLREAGFDNLSRRIRELARLGAKTGEIAKIVRRSNGEHPKYQHVRNVLNTPLKRPVETPASQESDNSNS